jgi:redox-sensing transcriptional repressor
MFSGNAMAANTNKNCILRLSQYKNALYQFKNLGFSKIFSDYLAEAVGVTSAQVRKDFSIFGIAGKKRGGFDIDTLIQNLNDILGKTELQKVILVGAGNLGSALLKYKNFEREGTKIVAAFDLDPAKQNPKAPLPILPFSSMDNFIRQNDIKIGIISVPDIAAQQTLDVMVNAGIRGILNFAPVQLKAPVDCRVNNVNLAFELENVIYYVSCMNRG